MAAFSRSGTAFLIQSDLDDTGFKDVNAETLRMMRQNSRTISQQRRLNRIWNAGQRSLRRIRQSTARVGVAFAALAGGAALLTRAFVVNADASREYATNLLNAAQNANTSFQGFQRITRVFETQGITVEDTSAAFASYITRMSETITGASDLSFQLNAAGISMEELQGFSDRGADGLFAFLNRLIEVEDQLAANVLAQQFFGEQFGRFLNVARQTSGGLDQVAAAFGVPEIPLGVAELAKQYDQLNTIIRNTYEARIQVASLTQPALEARVGITRLAQQFKLAGTAALTAFSPAIKAATDSMDDLVRGLQRGSPLLGEINDWLVQFFGGSPSNEARTQVKDFLKAQQETAANTAAMASGFQNLLVTSGIIKSDDPAVTRKATESRGNIVTTVLATGTGAALGGAGGAAAQDQIRDVLTDWVDSGLMKDKPITIRTKQLVVSTLSRFLPIIGTVAGAGAVFVALPGIRSLFPELPEGYHRKGTRIGRSMSFDLVPNVDPRATIRVPSPPFAPYPFMGRIGTPSAMPDIEELLEPPIDKRSLAYLEEYEANMRNLALAQTDIANVVPQTTMEFDRQALTLQKLSAISEENFAINQEIVELQKEADLLLKNADIQARNATQATDKQQEYLDSEKELRKEAAKINAAITQRKGLLRDTEGQVAQAEVLAYNELLKQQVNLRSQLARYQASGAFYNNQAARQFRGTSFYGQQLDDFIRQSQRDDTAAFIQTLPSSRHQAGLLAQEGLLDRYNDQLADARQNIRLYGMELEHIDGLSFLTEADVARADALKQSLATETKRLELLQMEAPLAATLAESAKDEAAARQLALEKAQVVQQFYGTTSSTLAQLGKDSIREVGLVAEGIKDNFNDLGDIASAAVYRIQDALLDLFVIAPLTRGAENWASNLLQAGGNLFGGWLGGLFGGGQTPATGAWGRGNQLPGSFSPRSASQIQVNYNVQSNDPVAVRQVLQESLPQITQAAKQGIELDLNRPSRIRRSI